MATEDTERILNERRLGALSRLTRVGADARTVDQACQVAAQVIEENPRDISFALIYLIDPSEKQARLARRVGLANDEAHAPLSSIWWVNQNALGRWRAFSREKQKSYSGSTGRRLCRVAFGRSPPTPWSCCHFAKSARSN